MITSADNQFLKQIRKLAARRERARTGLFVVEGEDLIEAATRAGWRPEALLRASDGPLPDWLPEHAEVERELLDKVSALGSGSGLIGIYEQRFSEPGGSLSVYLHGVGDPGNVGAVIRSAHGLCDGPVLLGPGCADPYSSKATRAAMGSSFAKPPAIVKAPPQAGTLVALDVGATHTVAELPSELEGPVTLCVGAEREGLPQSLLEEARVSARIPMRADGPESLNAAMAATLALYELGNRIGTA